MKTTKKPAKKTKPKKPIEALPKKRGTKKVWVVFSELGEEKAVYATEEGASMHAYVESVEGGEYTYKGRRVDTSVDALEKFDINLL